MSDNSSSDANGNGKVAGANGGPNGLARHLNWSNIPVEQVADGI